MKGNLFVLSGPSGVGKNAVEAQLKKILPELHRVITTTTREPRPREEHGIDYNFVTKTRFQEMVDKGEFLEWAVVHDQMYGTPKASVEKALAEGKQILLIIDVQGAIHVKKAMPEARLIFLEPESIDQIRRRISRRPDTSPAEVELRVANAQKELALRDFYDYVVLNKEGKLPQTAEQVAKIIRQVGENGHGIDKK